MYISIYIPTRIGIGGETKGEAVDRVCATSRVSTPPSNTPI